MLCIFERDPSRVAGTALRATLAPGHGLIVLRLALGRPLEHAVPGALWDAATLERAASLYIRSQFFNDQATHYEVLGLVAAATSQAINENYRLLMQLVHPDRAGRDTHWPADATARVNLARSVLRDATARADYDERLRRDWEVNALQAAPKTPVQAISRAAVRQRSPSSLASPLPEWATLGVGGFAREHPALTMFGVVIVVALSSIAAVAWSEPSFFLERAGFSRPSTDDGVLAPDSEVQTAAGSARMMIGHDADDTQVPPETKDAKTTAARR